MQVGLREAGGQAGRRVGRQAAGKVGRRAGGQAGRQAGGSQQERSADFRTDCRKSVASCM